MLASPSTGCGLNEDKTYMKSTPDSIAFCHEHPRMADGKDVYLVRYGFIDNAEGATEYLAEPVKVVGDDVETFWRDGGTHVGEEFKLVRFFLNTIIPSRGILRRLLNSNDMEDAGKKLFGMRRPLWLHLTVPSAIQPLIMSSISFPLVVEATGVPSRLLR